MPLFEVAIVEIPTKKEIEEGTGEERLVFGPKAIVALDAQSAALKAVMDAPDEAAKINRSRMQVLVRPFA
jgi:hypothetical protein